MNSREPFDLLRIREETFIRNISFHHEVESTNTLALELIARGQPPTPLLVITDCQTAGRGRGSNRWWSTEGALTFSVVVDTDGLNPAHVCQASLTTGLAICQALERFAPTRDFAIKWPNDVFLEGRKVGGILLERSSVVEDRLVIGIGVNVNNSMREAPADVMPWATSLADCLGTKFDRTLVLIECLHQLERRIDELRRAEASLLDQWRAYCLLSGRKVTIDMFGTQISGTCQGIDEQGALLVRDGKKTHRCVGGIVREFS